MAAMEFLAWLRTSARLAVKYEAITALAAAGANVDEGSVTVTRGGGAVTAHRAGDRKLDHCAALDLRSGDVAPREPGVDNVRRAGSHGGGLNERHLLPRVSGGAHVGRAQPALREAGGGEMMMPTVPAYSEGDTAIQINPATNAMTVVSTTIR